MLAIAKHRLVPGGFSVLDEPEAALSARNVLALLRRVHTLAEDGAQFVIATHSALPDARIVLCDGHGLRTIAHDEVPSMAITRWFLDDPAQAVAEALQEA